MEGLKNRQNSVASGKSHHGKRRHRSAHAHPKAANPLASHPMFQRRTSRLDKHRRNYFAWLHYIPDAFSYVGKYLLPKKKAVDPNAPVLGIRETQELRKLSFSGVERKKLLQLFREMTGAKRNTASFRAFAKYFRLAPDVWVMRCFEIINHQLTGAVTFLEFAAFLVKYLLVDRALTEEFCFRLLSRRGISFMPEYSILDLEDFLTVVTFRYKEFQTLPVQKKVALDLFSFVDADNDGGVSIDEFRTFCGQNPVLLRMGHLLLNHLRKCIFGLDFWVEKTRVWRAKQTSAVAIVALSLQRHIEAETYFGQALKEPVIDTAGNPLTNEYYVRQHEAKRRADDEARQRSAAAANAGGSAVGATLLPQASQAVLGLSTQNSIVSAELSSAGAESNALRPSTVGSLDRSLSMSASLLSAPPTSLAASGNSFRMDSRSNSLLASREPSFLLDGAESVDSQSNGSATTLGRGVQMLLTTGVDTQAMLALEKDYRTLSAFKAAFSMQRSLDGATFAADFPDIVRQRQEKRRERRQQEQARREHIIAMKRDAYVKLVKICSDFAYRRRDLRSAFDVWLRVAEKESRAEVNAPHRSDLHRVGEALPDGLSQADDANNVYADAASFAYDSLSLDDNDATTLSSSGGEPRPPLHRHRHPHRDAHETQPPTGGGGGGGSGDDGDSASAAAPVVMLGDDRSADPFDAFNIHSPPPQPAATAAAATAFPFPSGPSDSHSHSGGRSGGVADVSPFLVDDAVAAEVRVTRLVQDELRRAFHPQRPAARDAAHEAIVRDDDQRHAEKEARAVDDFLAAFVATRFGGGGGGGAAEPPRRPPKSLATLPPATSSSTPALQSAAALLLRQKPLPGAGRSRDTKILFLQQRAAHAQRVLSGGGGGGG
eukprot:gene11686-8324_t